jgi:hypothetical protein
MFDLSNTKEMEKDRLKTKDQLKPMRLPIEPNVVEEVMFYLKRAANEQTRLIEDLEKLAKSNLVRRKFEKIFSLGLSNILDNLGNSFEEVMFSNPSQELTKVMPLSWAKVLDFPQTTKSVNELNHMIWKMESENINSKYGNGIDQKTESAPQLSLPVGQENILEECKQVRDIGTQILEDGGLFIDALN